jgi:hypothetical protein
MKKILVFASVLLATSIRYSECMKTPLSVDLSEETIEKTVQTYQSYVHKETVLDFAPIVGLITSQYCKSFIPDTSLTGRVGALETNIVGRTCSGGGLMGNFWWLTGNIKSYFTSLLFSPLGGETVLDSMRKRSPNPLKDYLAEKTLLTEHIYQLYATLCIEAGTVETLAKKKLSVQTLIKKLHKDLTKLFCALRVEETKKNPWATIKLQTELEKAIIALITEWLDRDLPASKFDLILDNLVDVCGKLTQAQLI